MTSVESHSSLRVKKLSPSAHLPTRASPASVGFDLFSAVDILVPARGRALCPTDLALACPPGTYGRIAPRSGLALKHGLDVGGGVIDPDYRGNVGVLLFNHATLDFQVRSGDRIAQLVLERVAFPRLEEVSELDTTARGEGGFGSSG